MRKLTLARTIRMAVAVVLFIVMAAILWYFLSHRRPRSVVPKKTTEIPAKKVERQDGVEHLDFNGEKVIQAKAQRHYAGENGRYFLEGEVEVRDLGKEEGEEIVLTGDRISYDKDWSEAHLEGNARIQYRGLTFESSAFTYLKDSEILTTNEGVVYSSRKVSGNARRMTYSFGEESLRLEEEVELQLVDESTSDIPFVVRGNIVTFQRKEGRGVVEGDVSFSFGKSHGQADILPFELSADEQYARSFSLKGRAQATLFEEGEAGTGSSSRLAREIHADEIDLQVFKDMHRIQRVEAWENCLLKSFSTDGGETEVRSGRMKILFSRRGVMREFYAWNNARLEERGGSSQHERFISGQRISVGEKGTPWEVKAPKGGEARVDSPDSEVTAQSFTVFPQREVIEAAGDVKVILKVPSEGSETVGFFSSEQPVFGVAQNMRFEEAANRLILRENVRMWQGQEMLFADLLTAFRETGEVAGEGHVRTLLRHQPKSEGVEEEKIEIGGERVSYDPKQQRLAYERACWLRSAKVTLNSSRIDVLFEESTAEIREIEAQGRVTISEALREGQSQKALYHPDQGTVVLTGNPRITDKEKGVIEGDKLTFRLGEGRIQVENKDRERSTTVIKS